MHARRDIESSTALWEALHESVMDSAIALHHSCFRTHIRKHAGYEAQMEGDSFCVAFHSPQDASNFCIAVQVRMRCAHTPVWVLLPAAGPQAFALVRPGATWGCVGQGAAAAGPQLARTARGALQAALLTLDWPTELLALEKCRPVYVSKL